MVSLMGLSPRFQQKLLDNFPWLKEEACLAPHHPNRFLDFLEVYSGSGNLSAAVQGAARL